MSPTSHLRELDLLRKQVADLTHELMERDQTVYERKRQFDDELKDLHERSDMLHAIVTGIAAETGADFFQTLVCHLSSVLGVQYAVVGEVRHSPIRKICTIAVSAGGGLVDNFEYPLMNTPCETALRQSHACYERDVRTVFPLFERLAQLGVEGYCGVPLRTKDGAVIGLLVVMDTKPLRNTERLKSLMAVFASRAGAELQRRQGETKLNQQQRHLIEAQARAHLGSWDWDIKSGAVQWSEEQFRIFGYEPGSMAVTYETFVMALHQQDRDRVLKAINSALAGGTIYDVDCRIVRPSGEIRTIQARGEVTRDDNGCPVSLSNSVLDITDHKLVEEKLRISQDQLQQALRASSTGLWSWNTGTNEVVFTEEWKRQLGYEPTEISDSFETWTTLLHPDDRAEAIAYAREYVNAPAGDYQQVFRMQHKDGTYRWIEARASIVTETGGQMTHLLGAHTDITERKQAEWAILENQHAIRALHEISSMQGRSLNERVEALLCLGCRFFNLPIGMKTLVKGDELEIGQVNAPGRAFHPGMSVPLSKTYCSETLRQGGPVCFEHAGASPEWQQHPAYAAMKLESYLGTTISGVERTYGTLCFTSDKPRTHPFTDSERDFIQLMARWLGSEMDRQMTLDSLCQSEARYRTLYDETPSMYFTIDGAGIIRSVNQFGAQYLGYRVEDLVGKSVSVLFFVADRARICAEMDAFFQRPAGVAQWELRKVRSDGAVLWVREIVRVLQSPDAEPLALIVCEDITERKRTDEALAHLHATLERQVNDRTEALRRSEERFRQFFDHAPNVTCLKDHDGRYLYTNRRFNEVFGLDPGMAMGKTDDELFAPEQAAQFQSHDREVLTSSCGQEFEEVTQQRDGLRASIVVKFPVTDTAGNLSAIGVIATDVTERNRTQEALRESEARWQQFAESVGSAFWIADVAPDERKVLYVNSAFTFIWGIEREEIYQNWSLWLESIHPDDQMRVRASHDRFINGGATAVFHCEYRIVGRDGHIRWISDRRVRMAGWAHRIAGIAEDITHHKQQLMLMAQTESIGKIGGWQFDFLTDRLWWSEETYRLHDTTPESFIPTVETALSFYTSESRPIMAEAWKRGVVRGQPWDLELDLISQKGRRIAVRATGQIEVLEGRAVRAYGTFQDITERKGVEDALRLAHDELECKVMERTAELRESEERYARATAVGKVGVWELDVLNGQYHGDTNLKALFGYGTDELSTDPFAWLRLVHPDDQPIAMRNWESVHSGVAETSHYELRHIRKDGSIVWGDVRARAVRDQKGQLTHLIGATVDITGRKRAETILALENGILEGVAAGLPLDDLLKQLAGGIEAIAQDCCCSILLLDEDGRHLRHGAAPSLPDSYMSAIDGVAIGPSVGSCGTAAYRNMPVIVRDIATDPLWAGYKELALCHSLQACWSIPIASSTGGVLGTFAVYYRIPRDPTNDERRLIEQAARLAQIAIERKHAEHTLSESETRFRTLVANIPGAIYRCAVDKEWTMSYLSDAIEDIVGYPAREFIANHTRSYASVIHPDDRRLVEEVTWKSLGKRRPYVIEYRLIHANGTVRWVYEKGQGVFTLDGTVEFLDGAIFDITNRKQAQEALRMSEERFAKAFQASPHPVVISEMDSGLVVDANEAAWRLFGYRKEEVVGQTTVQIGLWHSEEERSRYLDLLRSQGSVRNAEVQLRSRNGEVRQCLLSAELIELNGKQCSVTVGDDVTERKRMERALRRTQFSVDQAVEAVLWVDPTGRIFNVNETACRMLGYSRQDLTAMTVHDIDPNFPVAQWAEHWTHVKERGALAFEAKYWSRTGTVYEAEVTFNYLQYDGKEYGCAILRDIGERKRAEVELHRSHAFLRQVIDTNPNFIFAKDRDGRFTMANKAVADYYGTTVEDLVGKSDVDFNQDKAEVEFFRQKDREVMESLEERFVPEEKITDSTGATRWLQTVKRPILDDQGRAHMVLGAATDITERKRMEEILLQHERDLHAALQERERISEDLHDGILQSLYAVGLGLETCKPMLKQQPRHISAKFMATLNQAIGQLNHVMGEVRNFIAGLESQVMQGGDFPTVLRNMVTTMSSSSSTKCTVRIDRVATRQLSTEQALHLINIVREGLSNALRHSDATRITVSLRSLRRCVRLAIQDDGAGFNASLTQGVGHGLGNMAARAKKVRGQLSLHSRPHEGTRIVLDLPKDTTYAHDQNTNHPSVARRRS